MKHTCHGIGCDSACAPRFLMCPPCWALVPKGIATIVYHHFNPRQCSGRERVLPSGAWMVAADVAVLASALLRECPTEPEPRRVIAQLVRNKLRSALRYARDHDATECSPLLRELLTATPATLPLLRDALQCALDGSP